MAIVDPGPFCEVDFEFDYDMTEFSHSLGRNLPHSGDVFDLDQRHGQELQNG
jgi:hypothetical protein